MNDEYAKQISEWTYEGIYQLYSFLKNKETMDELMNGDYYVCLDHQTLIGYFCFGQSARIKTIEENVYQGEALDFGLGMRPDLCGQHHGHDFIQVGLNFAMKQFVATKLRLSVAVFNERAICLYRHNGFRQVNVVTHAFSKQKFIIMEKGEM